MSKIKIAWVNFLGIWKDPVWSKVIATGIIAAVALIWAKLTNHTWLGIINAVSQFLSFRLPIYLFLSVIGIYFIIRKCMQLFKMKADPFWDEKFGNYTFKELYNILQTETMPIRTTGMAMSMTKPPEDCLLFLFTVYFMPLCNGLEYNTRLEDGGYGYSVFAPKMVGYGLAEIVGKTYATVPVVTRNVFKISLVGSRFNSKLDKLKLDHKMKELKSGKTLEEINGQQN